jgi:hypothetical protein
MVKKISIDQRESKFGE